MSAERRSPASRADVWRTGCTFRTSDRGATAIEYALVAAFIAGVIFVSLLQLGDSLRNLPFPLLIEALTTSESPS